MPLQGKTLGGSARLVPDEQYHHVALGLADQTIDRLWCSLFIVDPSPAADPDGRVREVIRSVAGAVWRGVDVRLLIGGSQTTPGIAEVSAASAMIARNAGIPTRTLIHDGVRSSHNKLVIADDRVLTGSHNWSGGSMSSQIQDSVLVDSPDLAALSINAFLWQWRRAGRYT